MPRADRPASICVSCFRFDGTLDRKTFGAFHDGGNDRPARQIAAIQKILFAAAIVDFEKLIFRVRA